MELSEQLAAWAAEDAAEMARGKAKEAYRAFVATLEAKEAETGAYLTDEGVDHENSEHETYESLAYWEAMLNSAKFAAHDRAEEAGVKL